MTPLDSLIHDVRSKCASLQNAAALLRDTSPKEGSALLALMTKQARSLARRLADFEGPP